MKRFEKTKNCDPREDHNFVCICMYLEFSATILYERLPAFVNNEKNKEIN